MSGTPKRGRRHHLDYLWLATGVVAVAILLAPLYHLAFTSLDLGRYGALALSAMAILFLLGIIMSRADP